MNVIDWLWAIPVFGLLIFIHELGHFAVAKWCKIEVYEFALGFGPVLGGFDYKGTRYNLRAVPLGGFVSMAGMAENEQDHPDGFNTKPIWQRAAVIAAGPVMNFVLAAFLYTGLLIFMGNQFSTTLATVMPTCQAEVGGQTVAQPCPAYEAGLQPGDTIVAINGEPVTEWAHLVAAISESGGETVTLQIQRGADRLTAELTPRFVDGRWMIGIQPEAQPMPVGQALVEGPRMTVQYSVLWLQGIGQMITGKMEAELSGPVGITREIASAASHGADRLLLLTAFLSINLGWFNLLPIPALDGSRLLFMGLEAVRGRRMDPGRENMVHLVGFMVLIGLILVTTYGDIFAR